MNWFYTHGLGISLTFLLAVVATWLGTIFPLVGGPVFGIVLGITLNNLIGKPGVAVEGIKFTAKKILQWAIIILGGSLSFTQIWDTGLDSLVVMLITLLAAFISAYIFGKALHIPTKLQLLIGVGTGICGGSAIAALSPIIEADEQEISYAISTIFLFNVIAVLVFPPLGHLLGLSDKGFGIWAGTAINDTSSVVAAGYAFSHVSGAYATIVKLTRTTMIIPISLLASIAVAIQKKKEFNSRQTVKYNFKKIFPWFILWFLAAALLNTLGLFSDQDIYYLSNVGKFMIVMALSAIGLSTDFKGLFNTGFKPIVLGFIVWLTVSIVSIGTQLFTQQI